MSEYQRKKNTIRLANNVYGKYKKIKINEEYFKGTEELLFNALKFSES
ncbi:MAG: hypothetical protein IPO06_14335 [Leptospiraceae bacterium]|nr:hypothetical protein [Leptospiraceae bacterium]